MLNHSGIPNYASILDNLFPVFSACPLHLSFQLNTANWCKSCEHRVEAKDSSLLLIAVFVSVVLNLETNGS